MTEVLLSGIINSGPDRGLFMTANEAADYKASLLDKLPLADPNQKHAGNGLDLIPDKRMPGRLAVSP